MGHSPVRGKRLGWGLVLVAALAVGAVAMRVRTPQEPPERPKVRHYRAELGPNNPKIKREGDKVYVWAGGPLDDAEWYDFTGSPFPPEELQFGIGRDRIASIDDPLFVKPDDRRLMDVARASRYRPGEVAESTDDIRVIGVVYGGQARAYPVALLDRHELVNDRIGGKPVTVGW